MRKKRIAITGIGPIASTGIGKDAFWEGIVNKNINIELVKACAGDMLWDEFYVHKIKGFDINQFGLNPNDLEYIQDWKESPIDWDLQYLLASVKLALDDSGIAYFE
jgi:3-oxoacyl-(acyl-carrier-protein) synthase